MKKLTALFLSVLILAGCQGPQEVSTKAEKAEKTVYAMDTVMSLTAYGPAEKTASALDQAEGKIHFLDGLLSISNEFSDVYMINRDKTAVVTPETGNLLQTALNIAELTGGDFDPTIFPLVELWGFSSTSTQGHRVLSDWECQQMLSRTGYEKLHLQEISAGDYAGQYRVTLPQMELSGIDLGGIAKGYTSEQVLDTLAAAGVDSAIVSLGGNVAALGVKPDGSLWNVAIQDPEGDGYIATLELGADGERVYAITSGGYERYFEQDGKIYHHILDPKTGAPAETDLLSVTIVSSSGTLSDGLSTALFVKGFDDAAAFWQERPEDFEMVLVTEEGLFATPGLSVSSDVPVQMLEVSP